MDLSDDSDIEDGLPITDELNEDDLLGPSDDEDEDDDVDLSDARGGRYSSAKLSPESAGSEQHPHATAEEFLDLAIGDEEDGLELNPSDSSTSGISPVKLKVHATVGTPPPPEPDAPAPAPNVPEEEKSVTQIKTDTEEDLAESEDQDQDQDHEDDLPKAKQEILDDDDDDDDDEEKGQRSRFRSERPPADGLKASSSYAGNPQPIRALGDHFRFGNQFRYGGGGGPRMRGNMRPHGMMQNHLQMRRGFRNGVNRMTLTNHHQIHPSPLHSLNGAQNRPDFRAPGPEIPVSQCSGQIFIDFNQPMQNQQQLSQLKPQLPSASAPQPLLPSQTPAPPNPPAQRQGVGIVRPQQQMTQPVRPRPVQNRPTKPLPPAPRPNIPRPAEERRFFPPTQQQRPRNQFVPQQSFRQQIAPPQQHIQVRPPIFLPNQQPVFIPQQQQQPNFIPPNPHPPPMMGKFPYVGPTGPEMMMMHPGPGPMDFNAARFQGPNQGPPPPMWLEPGPPFGGGMHQFQGMHPGFFPPQHHQPQMNLFPSEIEQHFMQEQAMQMMGYAQQAQFQVPRPPMAPHLYEQPRPIMEPPPRRERERYDYERESGEDRDRREEGYRKYASKRRSDEEEYRRSPAKLRRYEDSHYEAAKPKQAKLTPVDPRTAELAKIVGETKKEMGIDDEYMAKMEEQKRKRDEIMRKKGKKKGEETPTSSTSNRTSIYVNPAAFKGDLSLLNSQIQQEVSAPSRTRSNNPQPKTKPNTILRITKNSKGQVINMEKLLKVAKTKTTARN